MRLKASRSRACGTRLLAAFSASRGARESRPHVDIFPGPPNTILDGKYYPRLVKMRSFIPFSFSLSLLALVGAQAPSGTSSCDYYAKSDNTGNATATDAQQQWITNFVANVFAGNSTLFSGTSVVGILTASSFNNTPVRLVKYFDGTLYSTDGTTGQPQAVNWLDDGGVVTMSSGRIANSNTTNQ
jgi:hypothetical protein